MKKIFIFLLVAMFFLTFVNRDSVCLELGDTELIKIGTGKRTMTLLGSVYTAELWVPSDYFKESAQIIIETDEPMAVLMTITSRLITRDRFVKAVGEGFEKSIASGYSTDRNIDFMSLFDDIEIKKGDLINLYYVPGEGVRTEIISKKSGESRTLGIIPGHDFKKSLFCIWLGPNPVQESLKKGMLGRK